LLVLGRRNQRAPQLVGLPPVTPHQAAAGLDLDRAAAVGVLDDGWQLAGGSYRPQSIASGRSPLRLGASIKLTASLSLGCRRSEPLLLSNPKPGHFHRISIITKEDVMPAVDAVIVAAIVTAFVIFAGVLAWAEHQTRDLPPRSR
jgi:hypothetical protein